MLVAPHTDALRWFVARLVFCYACGLLLSCAGRSPGRVSCIQPLSAPLSPAQLHGRSWSLRSWTFLSIISGGQPVTGFGYFVGFPSLHVGDGGSLQFTIQQRSWPGGWLVAPINTMIASTFVLGYHYLVDVPGGVLLALGVIGSCVHRQGSGRQSSSGNVKVACETATTDLGEFFIISAECTATTRHTGILHQASPLAVSTCSPAFNGHPCTSGLPSAHTALYIPRSRATTSGHPSPIPINGDPAIANPAITNRSTHDTDTTTRQESPPRVQTR